MRHPNPQKRYRADFVDDFDDEKFDVLTLPIPASALRFVFSLQPTSRFVLVLGISKDLAILKKSKLPFIPFSDREKMVSTEWSGKPSEIVVTRRDSQWDVSFLGYEQGFVLNNNRLTGKPVDILHSYMYGTGQHPGP